MDKNITITSFFFVFLSIFGFVLKMYVSVKNFRIEWMSKQLHCCVYLSLGNVLLERKNLNLDVDITVNSRYLEVVGTIFYKFKLPEVQIHLHFG